MDDHPQVDAAQLQSGTSVLLSSADRETARDALHASLGAHDEDTAVLVVSTADAQAAVDDLRERGVSPAALGVVDASGAHQRPAAVAEAAAVDGPGALSSLGVEISDLLDRLDHRFEQVHVGFDSVSDLVAAGSTPAAFRFLHVLRGRIRASESVLVATIDRGAHEEEARRTIGELFDEVREIE
jgi:phosphotransferase system HPr-like phosphotransfer protein